MAGFLQYPHTRPREECVYLFCSLITSYFNLINLFFLNGF